jgi:hypothetical protein
MAPISGVSSVVAQAIFASAVAASSVGSIIAASGGAFAGAA